MSRLRKDSNYREKVHSMTEGTQWQTIDVFHWGNSLTRNICPISLIISVWESHENYGRTHWFQDWSRCGPHEIEIQSVENMFAMDLHIQAAAKVLTDDAAVKGPIQIGQEMSCLWIRSEETCSWTRSRSSCRHCYQRCADQCRAHLSELFNTIPLGTLSQEHSGVLKGSCCPYPEQIQLLAVENFPWSPWSL